MSDFRGEVCVVGDVRVVPDVASRVANDVDRAGEENCAPEPRIDLRSGLRFRAAEHEEPLTEAEIFAAYGVDYEAVGEGSTDA